MLSFIIGSAIGYFGMRYIMRLHRGYSYKMGQRKAARKAVRVAGWLK